MPARATPIPRRVLVTGSLAGAALLAAGCDPVDDLLGGEDDPGVSGAVTPTAPAVDADSDLVAVFKPNSIALRIAMVAAGEADLVATLRWGYEWDVAAAVLIAREAGADTSDAFGDKLHFNTPSAQAFGVLVTAPGIHGAAIERLRERALALR